MMRIKDFTGTLASPNIYSVDVSPSMHSILVAAEGWHGFTDLFLIAGENRQHIIDAEKDKLSVREARFTKQNEILIGLLSNELILFNISERKIIYRKQINTSPFSDFQLNGNHEQAIVSDESRSEEHTSELQSHSFISYAVFCLKKKKNKKTKQKNKRKTKEKQEKSKHR